MKLPTLQEIINYYNEGQRMIQIHKASVLTKIKWFFKYKVLYRILPLRIVKEKIIKDEKLDLSFSIGSF